MSARRPRYFVGDFETTVYKGQESTEVWAAALVELYTEDVTIDHSIEALFERIKSLKTNVVIFFHNLKFDGAFWLDFLLTKLKYKQAIEGDLSDTATMDWKKDKDMKSGEFKYSISDRGQWYSIKIKTGRQLIEIRDSLKLLPFSVKQIGKGFSTKHKKLEMEYEGFRFAGCEITDEERKYIANDVLVVKEALEFMFNEGHDKLTIGSCCFSEYKTICNSSLKNQLTFNEMFPDLYDVSLDKQVHKYVTAGDWIRKSYKGGWCYLVKGKENIEYGTGVTADVNSLYPSMMHSESGNRYPIGLPYFWKGNYIPDDALKDNRYYFVRIKTRFYLKPGYLPFVQIKNSPLYNGTECLESTDVYDTETGEYYTHYTDKNGNVKDTRVELTLTVTDYTLLLEHYELVDFEILDGCWFYTDIGIFDEYIDKYKEIKMNSKGAMRTLAKLFLNNLYGKLATSTDSSFKLAYVKDNGVVGFYPIHQENKKPGYIACGSAITSYARNFTIRAAQKNYHGVDKPGFIYADTDSIHCNLKPEEVTGIKVHNSAFCCWKLESKWDKAIFIRQKTYIEHVVEEDLESKEGKWNGEKIEPYYNIKCAGLPDKCKNLFNKSLSVVKGQTYNKDGYNDAEREFLFLPDGTPKERTLKDFKIGLEIPGKLVPKRIIGGILLHETSYKMR